MMHFTESKYEPMMNESMRYSPPGKCFMPNSGWGAAMTSEELLKRLYEYHKISVDKKTPYNYAKYGWIPAPRVINKGRAGGKINDYDECASVEFVASYRLKREKKVSKENVSVARRIALEGSWDGLYSLPDCMDLIRLALDWNQLLRWAKEAEDPRVKIYHDERSRLYRQTAARFDEILLEEKTQWEEYQKECEEIFPEEMRIHTAGQDRASSKELLIRAEAMNRETKKYRELTNESIKKMEKLLADNEKQARAKAFGSE